MPAGIHDDTVHKAQTGTQPHRWDCSQRSTPEAKPLTVTAIPAADAAALAMADPVGATAGQRPSPPGPTTAYGSNLWLAAIVTIVAILAMALFGVSTWTDYRATRERGWVGAENAARILAEQTERTFDTSRLITGRLVGLARLHGIDYFRGSAGHSDLVELAEAVPPIGSVWVMDATGNLVANSMDPNPPAANFADREYFTALRDGTPLHISPLLWGRVSNVWFFAYNRPIMIDGQFRGIAQTSMHAEYFGRLFEGLRLGPDAVISLYRREDGALVMRWPLGLSDAGATAAVDPLFREHLPQQPAGRFENVGAGGNRMLVAYRTLADLPIVVTAAVPRDAALAPFRERLYRNGAVFALGTLLAAALGCAALRAARRERAAAANEHGLRLDLERQSITLAAQKQDLALALAERESLLGSLRDSEQQLRRVLDNLFAFVSVLTSEGVLTMVNRAPLEAAGIAFEDVYGKRFEECWWWSYSPAVQAQLRAALDHAAQGVTSRYDVEVRMAGGRLATIDFMLAPLRDDDGRITRLIASAIDITDRKRAEATVRTNEQRLRLAQNAGRIGIHDYDVTTGRIEWDARIREIWAVPPDLPITYDVFMAGLHPDDRAPTQARVGAALDPAGTGEYAAEYRVIGIGDGIERWVAAAGQVYFDNGRPVRLIGTTIDITARKQAEAALQESEALYRALAANLPNGAAFVVDHDLRYRLAEGQALSGAGLTPAALEGKTLREALAPDLAKLYESHYRQALAGEPFQWEHESHGRHYVSHIVPLQNERGEVYAALAVSYDITRRKHAEQALQESEELRRLALEGADLGTWDYDPATDIAYWDARTRAIFGVGPDQPITYDSVVWGVIHPDDRERIDAAARSALDPAGSGRYTVEHRVARSDGAMRWLSVSGQAFFAERDGTRHCVRMLGVVQDVTERKAAETALAQALAEKETLLREIHHRIKNSLQLVSSALRLQAYSTPNAELRLHLAEAERRVFAIAKVHDQLYRQPRLTDRIDLGRYLAELCRGLNDSAAGEACAITVTVEADQVEVPTDNAIHLALIVTELVTNAIKYAFAGRSRGAVVVSFRTDPDGGRRLRVADNGSGLPAGFDLQRAAGLGMKLTQALVHTVQGTLEIESSNDGTCFTVVLPPATEGG